MILTRRKLLASAAAFGVAAAFAPGVRADEESDSIWDILARNARMKEVDPNKNMTAALSIIDTPEPILSFDTANNIQTAIAYYSQVVQQGGWEPPTRQTFNLSNGKDGRAVTDLVGLLRERPEITVIEAEIHITNTASRRIVERLGFATDGAPSQGYLRYRLTVR